MIRCLYVVFFIRFIFVGKRFFFLDYVVFEVKVDCFFYFNKFLENLVEDYCEFFKFVGAWKEFYVIDYIFSFCDVYKKFYEM